MLSSTGDRSAGAAQDAESMTLSQEILVLDLGDDDVGAAERDAPRRPVEETRPHDRRRLNPALSVCESSAGVQAHLGGWSMVGIDKLRATNLIVSLY